MSKERRTILITGAAGFIGFHVTRRLAAEGFDVIGLDNMNAYYDTELKRDRLSANGIRLPVEPVLWSSVFSETLPLYRFFLGDITDQSGMKRMWQDVQPDVVIHLAAQAGVRYSLDHPETYIESNIRGFFHILENCRHSPVDHLLYASSSSVYGWTEQIPFRTDQRCDAPASLYAATKMSNELMAAAYSDLYGIPATGMRFFTVYGDWGRPDMAYFLFTKSILENRPLKVFNNGKMSRDFTHVDDVLETILRLVPLSPGKEVRSHRLLNIGRGRPTELMEFIRNIEDALGKKALLTMAPMQPGDVLRTWADTDETARLTGYEPGVNLGNGIERFVRWYLDYTKDRP